MTSQLAQLKQQIESHHYTWRSQSNTPAEMEFNSKGFPYSFRIYTGVYVRDGHGDGELGAAQQAWEQVQEVMKGGSE
jgi:hypothetical protein